MTEAGQLSMDDAIWHAGKVWWVATIGSTGDVTFVNEPAPGRVQIELLVLERHDEVTPAGEALMDAEGRRDDANRRMCRRKGGPVAFELAAAEARRADADIAVLEAAGIVAGFNLGEGE